MMTSTHRVTGVRWGITGASFGAGLLLLLSVACSGGRVPAAGLEAASGSVSPVATVIAVAAGAPPAIPVTDYAREPLSALSPEAAAFLAFRPGVVTVGVVVPARQVIYVANPDTAVRTASVIKVAIMMDVLARADAEGRAPSDAELALLTPMITNSDNDSATALWNAVGGGAGLSAYLTGIGIGIEGIDPNPSDSWGDSYATGPGIATLLGRLAFDHVLQPPQQALALELLAHVDPAQRWGATAGLPAEMPAGTVIGVKDGWYPTDSGWLAGSVAIIIPGPNAPDGAVAYSVAVMTTQHATLEDAITTIEGIATRVHDALHEPTPTRP